MSPESKFRLHANVRIEGCMAPRFELDSVHQPEARQYFRRLGQLSRSIGGEGYTLHPGMRGKIARSEIGDNLNFLEDLFECPVGVEGMYPARGYMLDTWQDYQWLLESGVKYALDLSHVNIVCAHEKRVEKTLVAELLSSDRCIEIHLSDNDGSRDSHLRLTNDQWWFELLDQASEKAVIFNEGIELKPSELAGKVNH